MRGEKRCENLGELEREENEMRERTSRRSEASEVNLIMARSSCELAARGHT